jgi:putative membrane protein
MDEQRSETDRPKRPWYDDVLNVVRGILMGGADVIPGVSGGTIALILGIYTRLVTGISHFDHHLLHCLTQRQWQQAAAHIDLRFLGFLAAGIGLGVVSLGELMNRLLSSDATRGLTLSAFFGMILASTLLVARMIRVRRRSDICWSIGLGVTGAALAFWITGLPSLGAAITLPYVFFCGLVAICAMILPGISGAYLLLVLGLYMHLTGILRSLRQMQVSGADLLTVGVFATGCAIGIVSFSKALRWLLTHFHGQTMAVLSGFMIGALRKIWPFQIAVSDTHHGTGHLQYRNVLPDSVDGPVITSVAVVLAAMAFVLMLGRRTKGAGQRTRGEI